MCDIFLFFSLLVPVDGMYVRGAHVCMYACSTRVDVDVERPNYV